MKLQSMFLISILSIFLACSDKSDRNEYLNQPPSSSSGDCFSHIIGFIDAYKHYIGSDGVFFVKGVVTAGGSYGKKIKIVEDIKGNFNGSSSITLWNHWEFGIADLNYAVDEMVLALIYKIGDDPDNDTWTKQRVGDYCTLPCRASTLLASDETVTGIINTAGEKITVPWEELQKQLLHTCQSNMDFVENYHVNVNKEDVFFIKGEVVQEFFSNGIKINPLKDLKGNFSTDSNIVVWGKGDLSNSIDPLYTHYRDTSYFPTDILYMLIKPIVSDEVLYSNRKIGDYTTIDCAYSTVCIDIVERKLGNGEFVKVGEEWMTGEEFENKFSLEQ